MPRKSRNARIDNRTNRLKLPVARKPYEFTTVTPGVALGYRRNQGPGSWVMRIADGQGGASIESIAVADDHENADGDRILDFWQALERARKLAGERRTGSVGNSGKPATVAQALDDYAANLASRGGNERDALRLQAVLPAAILDKPVALLTARDLDRWKNEFLATDRKASTVLRMCKSLAAALTRAATLDPRITNRDAWRHGLAGIVGTHNPQNEVLDDEKVWSIVDACYELDIALGTFIEVHATTGARTSQIARLLVRDLQADSACVMMPTSRKGRGRQFGPRNRVVIPPVLAAKLRQAAGNRPASAPLLLKTDGSPWCPRNADHRLGFQTAVKRVGLDPTEVTVYALRHSSITRAIQAGVPQEIVAKEHDTSTGQIAKTYTANILDHSDEIARRGLLVRPPLRVVA